MVQRLVRSVGDGRGGMHDCEESKRVAVNISGCGLCWYGFMVYSNASDLTFLPSNRHLSFGVLLFVHF